MKAVYVIAPLAMLAAFAGYVVPANARLDVVLAKRAAEAERARVEEQQRLERDREQALQDHRIRVAAEKERQAEKERRARAEQERRDQELYDTLTEAQAAREALRTELAALESRRVALVAESERKGAELHVAHAALEAQKIARRNLDLELERMTQLLAEAVDTSIAAATPVFPAPSPRAR